MTSNESENTHQLFPSEPMTLDASTFELLAQVPEDGDEADMVDLPPSLHEAVTKTEDGDNDVGADEADNIVDNDSDEEEAAEPENNGEDQNHPASSKQLNQSPSSPAAASDPGDSEGQGNSSLPIVLRTDSLATSNRPFPCMVCGKRFTQKAHLIIHKRTHTGEKPYACHICHKRFAQSSHLTVHKRVHTGEKPFFCNFCGMGFCRRPRLESHILQHVVKEGRQVPASMRNQMLASLSMGGLGGNSYTSSGRGRRGARGRGRGRSRGWWGARGVTTRGSTLMPDASPTFSSQTNNDSLLSDLKSEIHDASIENDEDTIDTVIEDDGGDDFTDDSERRNYGPTAKRFASTGGRATLSSTAGSQNMNYGELDRFTGSQGNTNGSVHNRAADTGSLTMTGLVRTNSRVSLVDFTAPDIMQHLMSRDDIKSCDYCCIVFSDPAMYYLHRCMHDKMDVRRCNMCGKLAADKYDFMAHFLSQHK